MADMSDRERELEQEVEVQRAAADAAAELIDVLAQKLRFSDQARQDEVRQHQATMERLAGQSATIEDWGRRLERIFTRHTLTYEYLSEREHDVNRICDRCRTPYPCEDRKDAEWNPNPSSS